MRHRHPLEHEVPKSGLAREDEGGYQPAYSTERHLRLWGIGGDGELQKEKFQFKLFVFNIPTHHVLTRPQDSALGTSPRGLAEAEIRDGNKEKG